MSALRRWLLKSYLARFHAPRDLLRHAFQHYPDRIALIAARGRLTYRELADRVRSLAHGLEQSGVGAGDRVFSLLPDGWEQVEVRLAGFEANFVTTSFHASHDRDLILRAARMAAPKAFVFDPEIAGTLPAALEAASTGLLTLAIGPGQAYERLVDDQPARPSQTPIRPDDPAGLGFTSGTTGEPKGVFVTHGAIVTSLKLTAMNVSVAPGQRDVFLLGIPLVGAGSGVVLPMLFSGATLIISSRCHVDELVELIDRHKVTRAFMTPSMLIDLLDHPKADLSGLRNVIYGTAPMPAPKLREAVQRWGPIFQQGYGMAEVLPPVSLLAMADHGTQDRPAPDSVLRSAGHVVPEVRVRILDEDGRPLPPGETGEITISSPTTFGGYWDQPELTANVLVAGWYRTGDLGYLEDGGRLTVLGRRADLITRTGRHLHPIWVEEAAHHHPGVKEACLVEDPVDGQIALVVSARRAWVDEQEGSELAAGVADLLGHRLEAWLLPDRVEAWPALPRSYLVKVLRREVRDELSRRRTVGMERE